MKRFGLFFILMMVLVPMALGGSAPRIVQCGVDPVTVVPGQDFTLYADVSDADGLSDVTMVGLLSGDDLLMLVPKSDTVAGRFAVSYTMPETADAGTYTLSMAAVDSTYQVSSITYFTFSIAGDGPAVELVSPEDGTDVSCEGLTVFEWLPYSGNFDGYVFALDLTEGVRVTATVPPAITSLPVPGALWSMLPDGEYFWQVGVVPAGGGQPYAWSELRSFNVDCSNPWPGDILGVVVEKDPENQQLRIRSNWDHGPHGVMIQVTGETVIYDVNGLIISFDDVLVGDVIFATGHFEGDLFYALEIWVEDNQPPPPPMDEVMGHVLSVDLNNSTVTIQGHMPPEEVTIQITDETVILDEYGPISIEDIEVEDFVDAFGQWEEDLFVASEMFVMGHPGPGPGDHYHGNIIAIDPDAMTFDLEFDDHGAMETITVHVTDETILENYQGPIGFDDLEVGQEADVAGLWEEDIFIAHAVFIHGDPPPPPPMTFEGTIAEIDPNAMMLMVDTLQGNTVPVQVTEDTLIENPAGPLTFDDLVVGMFGMFHGEYQGDLFVAFHIFIDDNQPPPPPPMSFEGTIVEIDPNAMMLMVDILEGSPGGVPVQVTQDTVIESVAGPLTFDDLVVGMFGMFHGEYQGDLFVALHIFIDDNQPPPPPPMSFEGTIVEIDPNAMMLMVDTVQGNTVPVQVTEDTLIENPAGPLAFDDLVVGMFGIFHGEIQGDLFMALHIFIDDNQPPPPPPMSFEGTIVEIDPNAMMLMVDTVQGNTVPVQVTEDTLIENPAGPLAFDDLVVGMFGIFHGEIQGDLFMALHIFIDDNQPPPPPPMTFEGTIVEIDPNAMMLMVDTVQGNTVPVQVNENTLIENPAGPLAFDDLVVGMFGIFHGEIQGDLFVALHIFVDDNQPPPGSDVLGIVDSVDYNTQTFVVIPSHHGNPEPVTVQVDENTLIFHMGVPIPFDQIQVGMHAFVHGQFVGDALLAEEIHLHD